MKQTKNDFTILNIKDFEIIRTIGKGGFGTVKLAKNKKTR